MEANSFLSFSVLCVSFYDTAPFQQKSRDTGSQICLQGVSKVRSDLNCILRKAFNGSLAKCKLIQVGNLSK